MILLGIGFLVILGIIIALYTITRRKVVAPNEVHIVQTGSTRKAYGDYRKLGENVTNVYYDFPEIFPVVGNVVTVLPISVFKVELAGYEAYDKDRVPFLVDIFANFVINEPLIAAQKIADFEELKEQLQKILQGVVRKTLSTEGVEDIMVERKKLGEAFKAEANIQVQNYGVEAIYLEFMNIEDTESSTIISDIQAKRESEIKKESRIEIAENNKQAKIKEIDANQEAQVAEQQALLKVGSEEAKTKREVGIAEQQATQKIKEAEKITQEKEMDVLRVNEVKTAEIIKDKEIVKAEQDKQTKILSAEAEKESLSNIAEGNLIKQQKNAEGIKVEGIAKADAERAMQLAPVEAKIALAKEISKQPAYIEYLLGIEKFGVEKTVGVEKAQALKEAKIKIIATGNGQEQINNALEALSPKGGANIGGMLEAFKATTGQNPMDYLKETQKKTKELKK